MKPSYMAMCFAAAIFMLAGCGEKPESEAPEKAESPAAVQPTPGGGETQPAEEGPGETVTEPEPPAIETIPTTEDTGSEEEGEMNPNEGTEESAEPAPTMPVE